MKVNGLGRLKLGKKKTFLALRKAFIAIFRPTTGFKGRMSALGFQQMGPYFLCPQYTAVRQRLWKHCFHQ